jgi:hypothetical protein
MHRNQRCDLNIGDETYENLVTGDPARWQLILQAIAAAHVVTHRWTTTATNTLTRIETIVSLADGSVWHGERVLRSVPPALAEYETRTVLPWRR